MYLNRKGILFLRDSVLTFCILYNEVPTAQPIGEPAAWGVNTVGIAYSRRVVNSRGSSHSRPRSWRKCCPGAKFKSIFQISTIPTIKEITCENSGNPPATLTTGPVASSFSTATTIALASPTTF